MLGTIAERSRASFVMLDPGRGPEFESLHRQKRLSFGDGALPHTVIFFLSKYMIGHGNQVRVTGGFKAGGRKANNECFYYFILIC